MEITPSVKSGLIWLYGILLGIIIILKILQLKKKEVDNYLIRARSFFWLVVFFTVAFMINLPVAFVAIALLSYLALKEYFSLIPTRRADRRVLFWAYLSIPVQFYIIYLHWATMFYLFVPLYVFLIISVRMVTLGETEGFLKSLATIQYGLMTTVYSFGYLALFFTIPAYYNPSGGNIGLIFFILLATVLNDFAQMLCGKLLGKHKITPKVSPNKTWEGFFGGIIISTLFAVLVAPSLTSLSIAASAFAGFFLGIVGFLGDITMSAVKRDMQVKDTSNLIPGHGGILDRFDSLIFTAPLFFHFFVFINGISITRIF